MGVKQETLFKGANPKVLKLFRIFPLFIAADSKNNFNQLFVIMHQKLFGIFIGVLLGSVQPNFPAETPLKLKQLTETLTPFKLWILTQ